MLLPAERGRLPAFTFFLSSPVDATLEFQLRVSERHGNTTPDKTLVTKRLKIPAGENQRVTIEFNTYLQKAQYVFVCLMPCDSVSVTLSDSRITGILSVSNAMNKSVAKGTCQKAKTGSGIDSFEFWLPARRPKGKNFAMEINPPLQPFSTEFLRNAYERPFISTNAWVADWEDEHPSLTCRWDTQQKISRIILAFDADHDHPMESAQYDHPERVVPFTLKHFRILDDKENTVFENREHRAPRADIRLEKSLQTRSLKIEISGTRGTPAVLMAIRCYS
jgi:hypothetical protein